MAEPKQYGMTFAVDARGRLLSEEFDIKQYQARHASRQLAEMIAADFEPERIDLPGMFADMYQVRLVVMTPQEYARLKRGCK